MSNHMICDEHDRRVLVLDSTTVHRMDGTPCNTEHVVAGSRMWTPDEVRANAHQNPSVEWHGTTRNR